jgi:hypothetical protein
MGNGVRKWHQKMGLENSIKKALENCIRKRYWKTASENNIGKQHQKKKKKGVGKQHQKTVSENGVIK